ncbi:MarR family winged helix-turn-helix transcriptional regulator [Cellulomonas bogoriensis]|uniref:MarR family transcriptional regulator n=1 Tax=Cellulomonas bogoriensis 69B4 = DSM 16987 TaxID=1386082 RepID=A0A0A0BY26_9CELL|nr:MarR family winged helix-turn-helix transcriptional regulator [Cellulomonas bogoriensis]KGM12597.1 MarR family transcriptional regulator [Cellulomonas bogoriensis 69B4 = DSM 16987]
MADAEPTPDPQTAGSVWLTPRETATWQSYRRLKQLVDAAVAADLRRDSGISEPDYHVLSTLSETTGTDWRLRNLAERLMWTRSRLAHQLRRMEGRGLIARPDTPGPGGPGITLTEEGWRVIVDAAPHHVASVRRRFLDALDPEQQAAFATLAETVVEALQAQPDAASADD